MRRRSIAILCAIVAAGCDGGEPAGNPCGAGMQPQQSACVPLLDPCGPGEISLLGGGCRRVGVPTPCPAGWEADAQRGTCEPLLPPTACSGATMAAVGASSCTPLAECGEGPYGALQTGPDTVFVDASYQRGDADGSAERPFPTIGAAVSAAAAGAQIAIAAGTYEESISLAKQLTIAGRCPQMVEIRGQGAAAVRVGTSGAAVSGVTISGAGDGIELLTGKTTIDAVAVIGSEGIGVRVRSSAEAAVSNTLVADCAITGIRVDGGRATIGGSVVRDTRPGPDGQLGFGIYASGSATLAVDGSLIAGSHTIGLAVVAASATVSGSVIRDTHAAADDGQLGQGIVVRDQGDTAGQLTLRDALVSANTYGGVYVSGSSATLERVTVRDTAPATADDEYGVGVSIVGPGSLSLSDCVVSGNRLFGVIAVDAEATLERCVVRDTGPQASDERYGVGVVGRGVASRAKVTLVESVVSGNTTVGAVGETCDLTLERSVVRDTLQEPASGDFGGGISASKDSTLTLTESLVAANRHAGVLVDGGAAKIARSAVRDTEQMASSSGFGDGLQLGNAELSLSDSQVQGSARAGCVAFASSGSIARSLFRGGVFAVDLEKGSTIEVDELTVFADNVENQVTFGQQLQPAPAPLLPPP